ncbi:hypothetical protein D7X98_10775 [bacterium 1XD8-76]|nr:hypothetical protein D7X98_10775 [bacterium 1XD8-76]
MQKYFSFLYLSLYTSFSGSKILQFFYFFLINAKKPPNIPPVFFTERNRPGGFFVSLMVFRIVL